MQRTVGKFPSKNLKDGLYEIAQRCIIYYFYNIRFLISLYEEGSWTSGIRIQYISKYYY